LSDEELLSVKMRDLPLRISGTTLQRRLQRLYQELEERGLRFRPHVWLSSDWFTPDGIPGFAIPFYLAHPRLIKLERRQMFEVEGGTEDECMRILRHEAGHAISNAFRLHFRRRWRELFGLFSTVYPESYTPRPDSRNFVLNLSAWYAQAHPAEDFAETFAVWLKPRSKWATVYSGWPAMQKLEYVDTLMKELAGRTPPNRVQTMLDPLGGLEMTLRQHYRMKRAYYSIDWPAFYDSDLKRIFSSEPRFASRPSAAHFLRRLRPELRNLVAEMTGIHHYTIDHVLRYITARSRRLQLRLNTSEAVARQKVLVMLTAHTMNVVHRGYHRIAL
jgi:hypothetical protein